MVHQQRHVLLRPHPHRAPRAVQLPAPNGRASVQGRLPHLKGTAACAAALKPRLSRCPQVLLEAIRNILRSGQGRLDAAGNNPYLLAFEQCGGIDAVELLQVCLLLGIRATSHMFGATSSRIGIFYLSARRALASLVFQRVVSLSSSSAARQVAEGHAPCTRHLGELHWRRGGRGRRCR